MSREALRARLRKRLEQARSEAPASRPRVLLVDDEAQNLEALERQLRSRYEVRSCASAEAALELLRGGERFDLVLSDQRMPGMSGVELLAQVRELLPQAKRLIISGYTEVRDLVAAVNEAGAFRYVVKPCAEEDLLRELQAALAEGPAPRAQAPAEARVLFVDDDPQTLEAAQRALKEHPCVLICAASAEEARQHLAAGVDAALIDLNLGYGQAGGVELLEAARAGHPEVVRMIVSGAAETPTLLEAINRLEVQRYLVKPFSAEELRQSLQGALRSAPGSPS